MQGPKLGVHNYFLLLIWKMNVLKSVVSKMLRQFVPLKTNKDI